VAEQRSDGEPVGERADHRCFGERLDDAGAGDVAVGQPCDDEQHCHRHQQSGGEQLHPAKIASALGIEWAHAIVGAGVRQGVGSAARHLRQRYGLLAGLSPCSAGRRGVVEFATADE
jgi:hypothetical protein